MRVAVVGAGTARTFDEVLQSDDGSLEVAFSPSKGIFPHSLYYYNELHMHFNFMYLEDLNYF